MSEPMTHDPRKVTRYWSSMAYAPIPRDNGEWLSVNDVLAAIEHILDADDSKAMLARLREYRENLRR